MLLLLVGLPCSVGCAAPAGDALDVEALEAQFEERARAVLRGGDALRPAAGGFELAPSPSRGGLSLAFPSDGSGAVRFDLPGGLGIEVRELGLRGEGQKAGAALAYPRACGFALWTAQPHGVEEWLWFPEGAPAGGPLASWQVEGARLRRRGANVEVLDAAGEPRIIVSAPEAYASPLGRIATRLDVQGDVISLWVKETGMPLLVDPAWTVTAASEVTRRVVHTATSLADGRVLIAGGDQYDADHRRILVASAAIYDPVLDAWLPAAPMSEPRGAHEATLLADGRVLVTGGGGPLGTALDTAELYDPTTDTWTPAAPMTSARAVHTATVLADGRVLVAGGAAAATAEIYDPATGGWSPTPAMAIARTDHRATRLLDGRVLVTGGRTAAINDSSSVEIYDPTTGAWTPGPSMLRAQWGHTATLLEDGDVLVVGWGVSTEVYDPDANAWTLAGSLSVPRDRPTATRLCDGRVVVSGDGSNENLEAGQPVEVYDPSTRTFSSGPVNDVGRRASTATLLPDGKVLFVGGTSRHPGAEIYDPSAIPAGTPLGPLNAPRNFAKAVELPDGKILIAGGIGTMAVTELYDPASMTFSTAAPLNIERFTPDLTRLADGRVLISGGIPNDSPAPELSNEIYDPAANIWTLTAPDNVWRDNHTATLLGSGEVLIAGGEVFFDPIDPYTIDRTRSAALYRPADDTWVAVAPMHVGRAEHAATLLNDGRVLVVGGRQGLDDSGGISTAEPVASAEIYDLATRSWSLAAPMGTPRSHPTATRLLDGRVLVVETTAEVYDPATNVWTPTGPMNAPGVSNSALLLPTGEVLVISGTVAEIYHPSTNSWTPAPSTAMLHAFHVTVLLPSGEVLVVGWGTNAELYDPRPRSAGDNGCGPGGDSGAGGAGGGDGAVGGAGGVSGGVGGAGGAGDAGGVGDAGGAGGVGGAGGGGEMSSSVGSAGGSSTGTAGGDGGNGAGGAGGPGTATASSSAAGAEPDENTGSSSSSSGPGEGSPMVHNCTMGRATPGSGAMAFYLAVAGAALQRRLSRSRVGGRSSRAHPR
ncbi:Kelch repeat-containing protein [Sorangium sp. So ce1128]